AVQAVGSDQEARLELARADPDPDASAGARHEARDGLAQADLGAELARPRQERGGERRAPDPEPGAAAEAALGERVRVDEADAEKGRAALRRDAHPERGELLHTGRQEALAA